MSLLSTRRGTVAGAYISRAPANVCMSVEKFRMPVGKPSTCPRPSISSSVSRECGKLWGALGGSKTARSVHEWLKFRYEYV